MPTNETQPAPARAQRQRAIAAAALVFGLASPAAYVAIRLYEIAAVGRVDARLVLASTHTGFFWRALLALWCGALVATVLLASWRGRLEAGPAQRLADRCRHALWVLGPLVALLAWRFP